jgi:phosphatidylserine decarboxylase
MASHNNGHLMLKIGVLKARNLAPKDKKGTSDPYLVLTLGEARHSTISIAKNLNPEWNETMELPIESIDSLLLEVKCWDKDRLGRKDYMGEFDIALEDIFVNGAVALEVS